MSWQDKPLVVQSDHSLLLEARHPLYPQARDAIAPFAELVKCPEYIHTYRITPLSLWNAAASGQKAGQIISTLRRFSKYELPANVIAEILDQTRRYGRLKLFSRNGGYILKVDHPALALEILSHREAQPYLMGKVDDTTLLIDPASRGLIKQALIKIGYPVEDLAGYVEGAPLKIQLRSPTLRQREFLLRDYQRMAADIFYAGGSLSGGSGVIVLPCGAGKTIVGIAVMAQLKTQTLILATHTVAVRQWVDELLDKTTLGPDEIGQYTALQKEIKPVTIATYQILTYRKSRQEEFLHFSLFDRRNWGLIIYDEVHLLPAPVFRVTAQLQAKRRLGLTATLVREDGLQGDVFSLIGPKRYDAPWKVLQEQGWIAQVSCNEIRVPLPPELRMRYATASKRDKFRIASENHRKLDVIKDLLRMHPAEHILIIGQYLKQIEQIARELGAPLIWGKTPIYQRQRLYSAFKEGKIRLLVLSKVGNFSIDLPDANVLIQVSGNFGSRQEEAQRLGRILRPKPNGTTALFYTLVSHDTREQIFAAKRQLFLTEQGYAYEIHELDGIDQITSDRMQPAGSS